MNIKIRLAQVLNGVFKQDVINGETKFKIVKIKTVSTVVG